MAQEIRTILTDDIDKGPATHTVRFSHGNAHYEIDLNDEHKHEFEAALKHWKEHARPVKSTPRVGTRTVSHTATRSREELNEIRTWARLKGHVVSDRGRIPGKIIAEYDASH